MKRYWLPIIGIVYASELPSLKFWNFTPPKTYFPKCNLLDEFTNIFFHI